MTFRELPDVRPEAEPFWEGCKQHELRYQHCAACDAAQFYPRSFCSGCSADDALSWRRSEGRGQVYSFTVVRRSFENGWQERTPYVVALVDLDEGFRMMSNIEEADPARIRVGAPVVVEFVSAGPDVVLPIFHLAP